MLASRMFISVLSSAATGEESLPTSSFNGADHIINTVPVYTISVRRTSDERQKRRWEASEIDLETSNSRHHGNGTPSACSEAHSTSLKKETAVAT